MWRNLRNHTFERKIFFIKPCLADTSPWLPFLTLKKKVIFRTPHLTKEITFLIQKSHSWNICKVADCICLVAECICHVVDSNFFHPKKCQIFWNMHWKSNTFNSWIWKFFSFESRFFFSISKTYITPNFWAIKMLHRLLDLTFSCLYKNAIKLILIPFYPKLWLLKCCHFCGKLKCKSGNSE